MTMHSSRIPDKGGTRKSIIPPYPPLENRRWPVGQGGGGGFESYFLNDDHKLS